MLLLGAILSVDTAQAQQSRVPPAPPTPAAPVTPPTAASPRSAPSPVAAPRAAIAGAWNSDLMRMEIEQQAMAMSTRAMELQSLRGTLQFTEPLAALAPMAQELTARAAAMSADALAYTLGSGQSYGGAYAGTAPSGTWSSGGSAFRTQAPAPWMQSDPADSLYREARKALSSDANRRAADLFSRIRNQYPKSAYTPDALYYEAYALQRMGGKPDLTAALMALEMQQEKFPRASTRGDAAALRTRVEGQLARLGDQNAIASLADKARNATSDGCPREQDDERLDALNALAQMDADQALPTLKRVLTRREPCTQRLRRQAVWLIASRKQAEAASILLNVAKTDPDKDVREQAVFWMANVPTDEATTMLIDLAKKSEDLDLQKRAVYALSRSKSPRAAATLREIALDDNAEVELRGDALNWFMSGPGRTADDAMTFLKDVYGRADDTRFKQRVLQIIASRRTDETRAFLVDVAQNPKESMDSRRSAIWSLQGSGVTNAQLARIYDSGTDVDVRKQVIGVLAGLKENGGVDKLLDIARTEKNLELRKQAVTYLSRTKDPRALALLQEIINR
ncbi:MAG: HEAT repeat domain-containing protein [Gemmatimonadaceae bacterium]|nr:HEAT repeat domain-containing protein [Gemmatimonadaceae bacterium]